MDSVAIYIALGLVVLANIGATLVCVRYASRARADLAASREARDEAQHLAAETADTTRHILGPWARLVEAIEENPAGRLQITRQEFDAAPVIPAEEAIDRYLNNRWPGLELWQAENTLDLGIIIEWRNRP